MNKELKTGIRGLSIMCSDDGVWLCTKSDTGKSCMQNLSNIAKEKGNLIGNALFEWCEQTAKNDTVLASPDCYGAFCLSTETKDRAAVRARLCEPHIHAIMCTLLNEHVAATKTLDAIKKYIFYGKKSPVLELEHDIDPSFMVDADDNVIRRLHCVLGIVTESAELAEHILKELSGETVSKETWLKEFGDPCWYIAIAADAIGSSFDEVLQANVAKLSARYKKADGVVDFTEKAAQEHKGD